MFEVMKNGKTVYKCSTRREAWGFMDEQEDKTTEKYTVIDWR